MPMSTVLKSKTTSSLLSPSKIASAKAAALARRGGAAINWSKGVVTCGGGVAATIGAIKRTRGPNKRPTKAQVAVLLDPDVLSAFPASAWLADAGQRRAQGLAGLSAEKTRLAPQGGRVAARATSSAPEPARE